MGLRRLKAIAVAAAVVAGVSAAAVVLVPLARERSENVRLGQEWAALLKQHSTFSGTQPAYAVDVAFTYAAPTDQDLSRLRETYDLEAIAGRGSETERLINLMAWVHRLTGHANEPEIPKELNAFNLIRLAQVEHMQINCYMKTVILNEVYLAMGWPSRQTHLLPHSHEEDESHFVTSVYARSLGGWVLMDPDFGAYLTDEEGRLLGVSETRSRLIAGRPVVAKDVDAGGRLATALGRREGLHPGRGLHLVLDGLHLQDPLSAAQPLQPGGGPEPGVLRADPGRLPRRAPAGTHDHEAGPEDLPHQRRALVLASASALIRGLGRGPGGRRTGGRGKKTRPWGARPISAERAGHRTRRSPWGVASAVFMANAEGPRGERRCPVASGAVSARARGGEPGPRGPRTPGAR